MTEFVTAIKKHGALGVLALWLWITNARVEKLEQKLFDCYDDKAQIKNSFNHKIKEPQRYYAIIPNNKRYIKTKRHLGA